MANHKAVEMTPDQFAMHIYYESFGGSDLSLSEPVRQRAKMFERMKNSSLQRQFSSEFAAFIRFQVERRLKSAGIK